jgi:hypothetical protein
MITRVLNIKHPLKPLTFRFLKVIRTLWLNFEQRGMNILTEEEIIRALLHYIMQISSIMQNSF